MFTPGDGSGNLVENWPAGSPISRACRPDCRRPLAALAGGRLFLAELDRLARARADFAFETTLSGLGYHLHTAIIGAQSVVPQHRERIFLVGFKQRRAFEFPAFPAQGPKLESILETDVSDKYTLTHHLWN